MQENCHSDKAEVVSTHTIGNTTFIVRSNLSDNAKDAILSSFRRLIRNELLKTK